MTDSVGMTGAAPPLAIDPAPPHWRCSPRIALREFCLADRHALVAMHADPRVRRQLLDDVALDDIGMVWRFLAGIQRIYREHQGLGIWHASIAADEPAADTARRFIGWFNLMPLPGRSDGAIELGSRLLPSAWTGGLAQEGCELLLDHGFDTLQLPRIWATCHPDNRPARTCLAALGFDEHGLGDYEGHRGLYASIDSAHWQDWRARPRRERLRQALQRAMPVPQRASWPQAMPAAPATPTLLPTALPTPAPREVSA